MRYYRQSVAPLIVGVPALAPPIEIVARIAALDSASILIEEVLPVARELLAEDVRDLAARLAGDGSREPLREAWTRGEDLAPVRRAVRRLRSARRDATVPTRADEELARGILERGVNARAPAAGAPLVHDEGRRDERAARRSLRG